MTQCYTKSSRPKSAYYEKRHADHDVASYVTRIREELATSIDTTY